MPGWKLIHEIIRNLGGGWQVDAGGPQSLGHFVGLASGPNSMRLFFIARTEKLDPGMERICPPLGWLRVDGRLSLTDEELSAKLSLELPQALTPEEMANEINVRLLPIYRDFLDAVAKHNLRNPPGKEDNSELTQVSKHTVTEQQAASHFVRFMREESTRAWPSTYEALKATLGKKFVVEDEETARFNWCLAAISLGLQGVRNTFEPGQARRIEKWIFMSLTEEAADEVKRYDAAFERAFKWAFVDMNDECRAFDVKPELEAAFRAPGNPLGGPLGGIPGRLLHRWLGKNITNCEAEIVGQKKGLIDAWAMSETESVLAGLAVAWNWKKFKDDFNLVESDSRPREHSGSSERDGPGISDEDIPF